MTEKRKTRAELEAELGEAQDRLVTSARALSEARDESKRYVEKNSEQRAAIDSLKERLANAEAENQRMRGYLARVQEDDVVREELVAVGDPSGETRLVPKRKPTTFHAANDYDSRMGGIDRGMNAIWRDAGMADSAARPKHWVTY